MKLCKHINPIAKQLVLSIVLAVGFVFIPVFNVSAEPKEKTSYTGNSKDMESLLPSAGRDLATTHFTWGAELGSSIDLGGNDMSSVDMSLLLGYKNPAIQLLGIGAGIRRSFGSKNTFIPLFGVIRTSFRSKPSLFFMHFEAGYSFNSIANAHIRGDVCGALGLGINLSMKKKFNSHIIISYGFQHFDVKHREEAGLHTKNVPLARLSFGITL